MISRQEANIIQAPQSLQDAWHQEEKNQEDGDHQLSEEEGYQGEGSHSTAIIRASNS